jgi:hypothetical protein
MIINNIKIIKIIAFFINLSIFIIFHIANYDKFKTFKNSLHLSPSFYLYYQNLK